MARAKKTEESSDEVKTPTTRKTRTKKTETPVVDEQVNEILEQQEETTDEGPQPIGTLFNTINYNNVADLDKFITNLTPDQALYCVVQASRAAHQRNAYSMEESEVVSKAIRVLTTPPEQREQNVPEPEVHQA